jgi:hypothetical protein
MKKVIVPGIALLLGVSTVNAQAKNEFKYGLNEIAVAPFEKIRINANVQVVLVQHSSLSKVFVEGDQKMLNSIAISSENGELVISPSANFSGKHNLLVTIPVDKVKQIAVLPYSL